MTPTRVGPGVLNKSGSSCNGKHMGSTKSLFRQNTIMGIRRGEANISNSYCDASCQKAWPLAGRA